MGFDYAKYKADRCEELTASEQWLLDNEGKLRESQKIQIDLIKLEDLETSEDPGLTPEMIEEQKKKLEEEIKKNEQELQDIIDAENEIEIEEIDIEDDTIADTVKEEILDNPRKIGSANLMYVQDLIEKYCVNNPASLSRLPIPKTRLPIYSSPKIVSTPRPIA